MQIRSVTKIPKFIGLYFNEGKISLKEINEFSELLKNRCFTLLNDKSLVTVIEDKSILVDFYLDKSRLDRNYNCKYEEELEISKSVYNEIYTVELSSGGKINVTLDFDYKCNCLILNIED